MMDLISREALRKALKSNCDLCHDKNTNWCEHCCPKNEFEDLIDDAPAVKVFLTNEEVKEFAKDNFNTGYEMAKAKFEKTQGEWINDFDRFSCPFCKMSIDDEVHYHYPKEYKFNYCPNCGAMLRIGGAENE